jgi:hypothetical protein
MYNSYVNLKYSPPTPVRIEKAFFQIYIFIILIVFSWTSINIIRFPYGLDYGEAPLMDQAKKIENRAPLYKADINSPPYTIANYPPLYIVSVATVKAIFNTPLFQTGRVISLIFSLISGTLTGLFGYYLTNNKILGAISAAIFLGNPYVLIWSSLARVDMMALAFSLLGLFILFRRKDAIIWLIVACFCFLASAFTRQTYLLSGPLAGFAWLYHHNHRRAMIFLVILGISTLLIFGTINAITQGGFYTNIIIANINQYDISRTIAMVKQLFVLWPIILIASTIILIMSIQDWRKIRNNPGDEVKPQVFLVFGLGFYSIAALIIALTVGKVGSDVNYFLELMAVCAIWMAIVFSKIMVQEKTKQWLYLGLFFIQLTWILIGSVPLIDGFVGSRWERLSFYEDLYQSINQSAQKGIVLSDDYLDMVVLSGQSIYYQPFEYGQLYQADLWNPTALADEIKSQEFPLIVIGGDTLNKECCWPPPIANAIESSYQIETGPDVLLLTPKP